MKISVAIAAILLVFAINAKVLEKEVNDINVKITFTNEKVQFSQQPSQAFKMSGSPSVENIIFINDGLTLQNVTGFGAAFTDSTAYLIKNLPADEYKKVLNNLFNRETGIGISYIRLPISVTDFSLSNYTYDNMPAGEVDPALLHFSIAHDEEYIIPMLKEILEINPDLQILISPWTAPAWMKTTDSLLGTFNGTEGNLIKTYYASYALYFAKIIKAYAAHGITIQAMTVQNEPLYGPTTYPGLVMDAVAQTDFINNYLAPAFISLGIKTKVFVFDHNWDRIDYPEYVLSNLNDAAKKIVAGSALHCYYGGVTNQTVLHLKFPDYKIYQTECSGEDNIPDFIGILSWDMQNLLIGLVNNWGEVSMKWNIALDQNKGPQNHGCPNCRGLILINTTTNETTYNADYYSMGTFSKYVVPGSTVTSLESDFGDKLIGASFIRPDNSRVAVLYNNDTDAKTFNFTWFIGTPYYFETTLPGNTIGVYEW